MTDFNLTVQQEKFKEAVLSSEEIALFNAQWEELFMPAWSLEKKFINSRKDRVIKALQASKMILDEKKFGGFNCGANEIGFSPIRPGHVGLAYDGSGDTAEGDNTWIWTLAQMGAPAYATAYTNWIHSDASATTAYTLPEDLCVYPMYLVDHSAIPILQTIKMDIGRTDILYYDLSAGQIRDAANGITLIPLPETFWGQETDVLIGLQAKKAGNLHLRLGGFTFATGAMLDASSYVASTNTIVTATIAAT